MRDRESHYQSAPPNIDGLRQSYDVAKGTDLSVYIFHYTFAHGHNGRKPFQTPLDLDFWAVEFWTKQEIKTKGSVLIKQHVHQSRVKGPDLRSKRTRLLMTPNSLQSR